MFDKTDVKPLENKVWLSSPTMHGEELQYMKDAYDTNWMSTVGENINEVERISSSKVGRQYSVALSSGTAALHRAVKVAGLQVYGAPEVGHGAVEMCIRDRSRQRLSHPVPTNPWAALRRL